MHKAHPFANCEYSMFKILLIDRCSFTRSGFEAWLNHSGLFAATFKTIAVNNLFLAREHIQQWRPALVIVDLHGFMQESQHLPLLSSLLINSETRPVILLQSGEGETIPAFARRYPLWAALKKSVPLTTLATVLNAALASCAETTESGNTLLTRQEERVLALWMEGASNQKIAVQLSITGKTVYTYKRNIRMKLHMDTRFSPFLMPQEEMS